MIFLSSAFFSDLFLFITKHCCPWIWNSLFLTSLHDRHDRDHVIYSWLIAYHIYSERNDQSSKPWRLVNKALRRYELKLSRINDICHIQIFMRRCQDRQLSNLKSSSAFAVLPSHRVLTTERFAPNVVYWSL